MIKRGDFNFVWIFAVLAGTTILILMIYAAVRTGTSVIYFQDTDLTKQVVSYLDPFQAGFSSSLKGTISSKREIIFDSYCDSTNFGYQTLRAKQVRNLNEDFNVLGEEIKIKNKYVYFSKEPSKKFYVFSVPIEFAFKIYDVLIIDSRDFCFLEGYEKIPNFKNTLSVIKEKALFGYENCSDNSIKVCFDYGDDCDIKIIGDCNENWCDNEYETGKVLKEDQSFDYVGNLLYPAIFGEKEIYDCNLKRLLFKNGILSLIYKEKAVLMSSRNCPNDLAEELDLFSQLSFNPNSDLKELYIKGKFIKEIEGQRICNLWSR
ncbi:MAG: hypothetical protein QW103_00985 [Candidatus Pacearchaeota archaeon]